MSHIQVHKERPEDFNPVVEVAACYLEVKKKLLMLQTGFGKAHAETWGLPGGKLEKGESALEAASRELLEETGIYLETSSFFPLGALYIRKPEIDFIFHMFKVGLDQYPTVTLSEEHLEYRWVNFEESQKLRLMVGALEVLELYFHQP